MNTPQLYSTARLLTMSCLSVVAFGAAADDVALTPTDEGRYNVGTEARAGKIDLSGGNNIRVGTTPTDVLFNGFMVFDTSGVAGPLNSASLDFEIAFKDGSPNDLEVYGVSSAVGFDNTKLSNTQLKALVDNAGPSALVQNLGTLNGGDILNANVTSFVNAQRVAGNSTVGFVLKNTNNVVDASADWYRIWDSNDASAIQVPELNVSSVIAQPQVAPVISVTDLSPNGGVDRDLSSTLGTVTATPTLPTTTYEVQLDFSSVGGGVETIAFDVDYSRSGGTGLQYNTNGNVGVTGSINDNYVDDLEQLTVAVSLNNAQTTYSGAVDIRLDKIFTELAGANNVFNYLYSSSNSFGSGSAGQTLEFTMPAEGNLFESDEVTISPFVFGTEIALEGVKVDLFLNGLPDIFSAYSFGDANGDGAVDGLDVDALAQGFGASGNWSSGDFNGDGTVDGLDVDALAQNFGAGQAAAFEALSAYGITAVPEPTSAALLALGGLLVARRRRSA